MSEAEQSGRKFRGMLTAAIDASAVPAVGVAATIDVTTLATIALRLVIIGSGKNLEFEINITQMMTLGLSLLTNASATSIIAFRAW